MTTEERLLSTWRGLSPEKQEFALSLIESLAEDEEVMDDPAFQRGKTPFGQKLRQIRARIIASGESLLTSEQIEREIADRRGGLEACDR